MFLVSDGASAAKKRTSSSVFCLPSSRCSVSFGSLDAGLVSFTRSVQAHPFNQKVVILVSFEDACESEEATFSPAALAEVEREEHKQHRASRQPRASSSCPSSSPASSSSPFLCSSSSSSSPSSLSSSSCEARELVMRRLVELVRARSTGVFLHDVSLASFLSLPLQKFLFSQHDACLLSWTGASPLCASPFPCPSLARATEGQAAEEREQATNGFLCSDVYLSDVATGGNAAAMTAEEGGSLLMRVDGFLYQTLGVDTLASLPHSVKKALPSTTRFLRIPLAHPAVLRHQRALEPERPSPDAERSVKREGNLRRKKSRASQPSKMFLHLQYCLGEKLAPLSFLCALKMPFPGVGDSAFSHLSTLRASLEQLLRAANSSAAFVALTGVSAQHRRYLSPSAVTGEAEEGEADSMPREADDSFLAFEADSPQEKEGRSPGETRQAGSRARENNPDVWLPNWNKLLARLRQAAERRNRDEDGEASRATSRRKRAGNLQRSTISEACDDSDESEAILDVSMEEETDTEQEREQGEGEMEEEKQFPFPRLKARLESAALRLAFGEFAEARKGERDDRRQGTEREKLADEIIQVLGSYGLDIPLSFDEDQNSLPHDAKNAVNPPFSWVDLDSATPSSSRLSVLTIEGGIFHPSAVAAVVRCLSGCLRRKMLRQRRSPPGERGDPAGEKGTETLSSSPSPSSSFSSRSPWFAVSTFGVADAPTLFKGLPHGAVDLSSDSSCHFVAFLSTEDNCAHAVSLRSVSAVDAAASLP